MKRIARERQSEILDSNKLASHDLIYYKDICKKQRDQIDSLQNQCEDQKSEIQRIKAEMDNLNASKLRASEKVKTEKNLAAAAVNELKKTIEDIDAKTSSTHKKLSECCRKVLRFVSGLERHTMHGLHIVASKVAVGLILKIRQGLEEMFLLLSDFHKENSTQHSHDKVHLST